jgi:hypothetical protein
MLAIAPTNARQGEESEELAGAGVGRTVIIAIV